MAKETNVTGNPVRLAESVAYAEDSIVSKTLMDKPSGTLTLFAFDQDQGLSEHTSPYDATVIILDGIASLTIGGRKVEAASGDMVIMPAEIPHDVRAEKGRFKMLLIMIR